MGTTSRKTDGILAALAPLSKVKLGVGNGMTAMRSSGTPYHSLSLAPFVLATLRYGVAVDAGRAAQPEDIALRDRGLQVLGLVWAVLVALAVY